MRELIPTIGMQVILRKQINDALQAPAVNIIRRECEAHSIINSVKSSLEGQGIKLSDKIMGKIYSLCMEVKKKLNFEEDINFYIEGNPEINAFATLSEDKEEPHIIVLTSGLLKVMSDDEIKCIVGHEMGHLINRDLELTLLYDFIFPDKEGASPYISDRKVLYERIAEIGADRYGYMANENLSACITAMFKLACGLELNNEDIDLDSILADNDERLEYFLHGEGEQEGVHPVFPMRIKALQIFATAKTQKAHNEQMDELISSINPFDISETDTQWARFFASAGLWIARANGKKDIHEENFILRNMATYTLYPYKIYREVEKSDDIEAIIDETSAYLVNEKPDNRLPMIKYLMEVVLQDGVIEFEEMERVFRFADAYGINDAYVYSQMQGIIQSLLEPIGKAFK